MIGASRLRRIQNCRGRLKEIVGDEGVIQLAKDGICPHYVMINPITEEETIWFNPSELNEWFETNFVKYKEATFVQKYTFLHFNKEMHTTSGEIPEELLKIKELYQLPLENIPTPPAIYFLCKEGKIKYIGQAANVSARVITHISEGLKDFDNVFFITCPINRLTELESSLIRYYRPELNKTCQKNLNEQDITIVKSLSKEV